MGNDTTFGRIAQEKQYNSALKSPAPYGTSDGLVVGNGYDSVSMQGDIYGRMSLGIVAVATAALLLFYIGTRNVQGGG